MQRRLRRSRHAACVGFKRQVQVGGAAIRWALQASPGDVLGFSAAAGWYSPPSDTAWQLVVADMTGHGGEADTSSAGAGGAGATGDRALRASMKR